MRLFPGSGEERGDERAGAAAAEGVQHAAEGAEVAELVNMVNDLKRKLGLDGNASIDELAAALKVALGQESGDEVSAAELSPEEGQAA